MKSNRTPYTSGRFSVKQGKEESFISAVEAVADWTMVNFQAAQECKIRSKLDTQSGFNWTLNPELTGQSIRS